jgi:hypothetical protein
MFRVCASVQFHFCYSIIAVNTTTLFTSTRNYTTCKNSEIQPCQNRLSIEGENAVNLLYSHHNCCYQTPIILLFIYCPFPKTCINIGL